MSRREALIWSGTRQLLHVVAFCLIGTTVALTQTSPTAPPQPATTASIPAWMLVLDASGSMWKQVSDAAKRSPMRAELAAQFVEKFTDGLANNRADGKLGLVRLGYQYSWQDRSIPQETLCRDVETVVPPRDSAGQVRSRIKFESGVGRTVAESDYNPKGHTPLKLAMERAANEAPLGGATLIVVTDLESDDKCLPDPCGQDGRPIPELQQLFLRRNVRVRYVIAAGLIGTIGARARRFAECFGAEFLLLETPGQAGSVGTEVARRLVLEAPPIIPPRPKLGTIAIYLRNADGIEVALPGGGHFDVHSRGGDRVLSSPGRKEVDPGRYKSSLTLAAKHWEVDDVVVSADRMTEVTFVVAPSILNVQLVDSDYQPIGDRSDAVWEVVGRSGQNPAVHLVVKGARLSRSLPPGRYQLKVYTEGGEFTKDIMLETGRELNDSIQVR